MKQIVMLVNVFVLAGFFMLSVEAQTMNPKQIIESAGSKPSVKASEVYSTSFTGTVRLDPLFSENDAAPYSGAYVTFEPGARTAWHTHPVGQRLIVVAGVGRTQEWGGPVKEIRPGDVIWCPPGVKHWHGAAPQTAMTHLALTGVKAGKNVEWLEKVTDAEYGK